MKLFISAWIVLFLCITMKAGCITNRLSPDDRGMTFSVDRGIISDSRFLSVTATLTYPKGELAFIKTMGQYTEGDKVIIAPKKVILMIETRHGARLVDSPVISGNVGMDQLVLVSSYTDSYPIVMSFSLERDSLASIIASGDWADGAAVLWVRFGIPVLVNDDESKCFHEECFVFTERILIRLANKIISVIAFENFGARFDVGVDETRFGLFGDLKNEPTGQP